MRFFKLAFLMVGLVVIEALYSHLGGPLVRFFSPLLVLQASAFVGVLLGPMTGVVWGVLGGLLEEAYFASIGVSVGLTSVIYLWVGWIFGKWLYGRVDLASALLSSFVTAMALILATVAARVLEALFSNSLPTISGGFTLGRVSSLILQVLMAPVFFWVVSRFLGRERAGRSLDP